MRSPLAYSSNGEPDQRQSAPEEGVPRLLRVLARAQLPTRWGDFDIISFAADSQRPVDDVAIVRRGAKLPEPDVTPIRLHSECLTSEVFGSLRCDCRDQLELAISRLAEGTLGAVLYLRQEGRGIGIANKVRAYELQDQGLDTVEANRHLGFDDDLRRYDVAAGMLLALGITRVSLHTNNPQKSLGLASHGVEVVHRVPLVCPARPENELYLRTKRERSGHLLPK